MFLYEVVTGKHLTKRASDEPPLGPAFPVGQVEKAYSMEIWATSFTDEGPDANEFILKDKEGKLVASVKVEGY